MAAAAAVRSKLILEKTNNQKISRDLCTWVVIQPIGGSQIRINYINLVQNHKRFIQGSKAVRDAQFAVHAFFSKEEILKS